jgi:hypothetical protein
VLGALWFATPLWFFMFSALLLYCVPLFKPFALAMPFLITLFFAATLPSSFAGAVFIAVLMFLVLGVKDLIFIRRVEAYETLVLLVVLLSGAQFFRVIRTFEEPLAALMVGALFFVLLESLRVYRASGNGAGELPADARHGRVANAVTSLVLAEWAWVLMLLPIVPIFQTLLFFAPPAMFIELLGDGARKLPRGQKPLGMASVFAVLLVVILTATEWGV